MIGDAIGCRTVYFTAVTAVTAAVACSSQGVEDRPDGTLELLEAGTVDARNDNAPADASLDAPTPPADIGVDADADADADAPIGDTSCYGALGAAVFCSGFESPDLAPWAPTGSGGTAARTTDKSFRGVGALLGASTTVGGSGSLTANVLGGRKSGKIYMRAQLFVASSAKTDGVSVLAIGESVPPYGGVSVQLLPSNGVLVNVNPGSIVVRNAGATLARDRWVCVQVETSISETAGSVTFQVDGVMSGQATKLNTLPGRGYEIIAAGVNYTPPSHAATSVRIDEVAVDTSPIPCP